MVERPVQQRPRPLNEARMKEAVLAYRESLLRIAEWVEALAIARDRADAARRDVDRINVELRAVENQGNRAYRELFEAAEGIDSSWPVEPKDLGLVDDAAENAGNVETGIEKLQRANATILAADPQHPGHDPGFAALPSAERNRLIAAHDEARFVRDMEARGYEVLAEHETGAEEWCPSCGEAPQRGRDSFGDCADCGGTVRWIRSIVKPGDDL